MGYEQYCIDTNNYPSWAGIAKFVGVPKAILISRLKSNEEFKPLYELISNRLEELTISRNMNNFPKFGLNMLEKSFGEHTWEKDRGGSDKSDKMEKLDEKYSRGIGDML